jgi:hypothetical protein
MNAMRGTETGRVTAHALFRNHLKSFLCLAHNMHGHPLAVLSCFNPTNPKRNLILNLVVDPLN